MVHAMRSSSSCILRSTDVEDSADGASILAALEVAAQKSGSQKLAGLPLL